MPTQPVDLMEALPDSIGDSMAELIEHLKSISGEDFDRVWPAAVVHRVSTDRKLDGLARVLAAVRERYREGSVAMRKPLNKRTTLSGRDRQLVDTLEDACNAHPHTGRQIKLLEVFESESDRNRLRTLLPMCDEFVVTRAGSAKNSAVLVRLAE